MMPPGWINDPPGLIERLLAGSLKLSDKLGRMMTQPFMRGLLGAKYAKKWGDLEEKASMIATDLSERIQLGLVLAVLCPSSQQLAPLK